MSFRIIDIETHIVEHPLLASHIIHSNIGFHDVSRYLTVILRDEEGVVGYGEAATTPLWSGETAETAQLFINQVFAPLLKKSTFDHPSELLNIMEKAVFANPFAKSAIDTAAWDLWARRQNKRAAELFGDRKPVKSIPTRASVGCYKVDQTVRIATDFWNSGVCTLKFKIGVPGFDDIARLRAVRESLGEEPIFTVDANGAYETSEHAIAAIQSLLPFNLALVEQPSPRERVHLLGEIRRNVEVPILADECIFTVQDLHEVLDSDACDFVSLYPGKNGGVTNTLEMARIAQAAGKPCALGSNLETDLGQAAMAAVAAGLSAFPVEELACDLPASLFYQRSSVTKPLAMVEGRILVPQEPGFGVEPLAI